MTAGGTGRFGAIPWASGYHPQRQRLDDRYPLVVEAMNHLKVRSCLIDGEVVCCDERA